MEHASRSLRAALPPDVRPARPAADPVVLGTPDPLAFWSGFLGAVEAGASVVLMDPHWPQAWVGELGGKLKNTEALPSGPAILVPTSGSTGLPKFCIHSLDTLFAAARGFAERFGKRGLVHAVNVLPRNHIGGLMPVLRAAVAGGRVRFADYRDTGSIREAGFPLSGASISVVPTQLRRMAGDEEAVDALKRFGAVFTGGAACPPDLLDFARRKGIPLSPCYGSTETAAMVTALEPEAFLAGANGAGTALPHARIELDAAGRVLVRAASNLLGYFPERAGFCRDPYATGDTGRLDEAGNLHISGRLDRVIITGGKKVHPELVEAAAMATGLVRKARCTGVPDPDWGTRVELEVVPEVPSAFDEARLRQALALHLPRYALPRLIHLG